MKTFLCSLLIVILFACRKNNGPGGSDFFFQVEIETSSDINCGFPDIAFLNNQEEAYKIIGDNRGTYVAFGLPKVNYQPGDKRWVKIRKTEAGELRACHTFGPSWSWVTITETK